MIKRLWKRLLVKLLCDQGWHGNNLVHIDTTDGVESHCLRCGLVTLVDNENLYWGYDSDVRP